VLNEDEDNVVSIT